MNLTPNKLVDIPWDKIPQDVSVLHRPPTFYWDGEIQTEENVLYVKNLVETEDEFKCDIVNSFFVVISKDDSVSKSFWVLVKKQ